MKLLASLIFIFAIGAIATAAHSIPNWQKITYQNAAGESHVFALKEPTEINADSYIFIYMHGAAGLEEQGMELFPSLRKLLTEKKWIYVCPRDDDYQGLRNELELRYGKHLIFLSGASAGGNSAFEEATRNPSAYKGLILLCPAIDPGAITQKTALSLKMPVWIIAGDRDGISIDASRKLYQLLRSAHRPVDYDEIPGGNHNAPLTQINWRDAVSFVLQQK